VKKRGSSTIAPAGRQDYRGLLGSVSGLLEEARRASARSVNAILTATYWEIGRRIVEFEQQGKQRAEYGRQVLERLSRDLTERFGRGFGYSNLNLIRQFYVTYRERRPILQSPIGESREKILQTVSGESEPQKIQTVSGETQASSPNPVRGKGQTPSGHLPTRGSASIQGEISETLSRVFPLSWSHYVRLLALDDPAKRDFYEEESRRGGWSVRQLDRQINAMFYERLALSRRKGALLRKAEQERGPATPEEEIKDPYVLEFLGMPEPDSEKDLESRLIAHLADFLLELGYGFTFVARQKRLQVGTESYYLDLLLYHRGLKCLVAIDLKIGKFTHADAGQMNLYLNYLKENETLEGEAPPIGLILCAEKDEAVARYALGGLTNKLFASRYRLQLPDPGILTREIEAERRRLESSIRRTKAEE